ncbi:hypothetical protein OAL72_01810 [bacterium]|nr:hypothetical protein [bacterium]
MIKIKPFFLASVLFAFWANCNTQGYDLSTTTESIRTTTWNYTIDEILIGLNRVKKESHMFPTIGGNGYPIQYLLGPDRFQRRLFLHSDNNPVSFSGEQKRLITLALNTESLELAAVAKLRSQQFPKSNALEKQIKLFTSNYCSYVSKLRFYWENSNKSLPRFNGWRNGWRQEASRRKFVYQSKKAYQLNQQLMNRHIKSLNLNLNSINRLRIKTTR